LRYGRFSIPAADLIDVSDEVGRVFVDPTRASTLELIAAITSGQ
jgi:hypothetical protein